MAPPTDQMEPQGILQKPLMLNEVVVMAPELIRTIGPVPVMEQGQARTGLLEQDHQATAPVGPLQDLHIVLLAEAAAQVQAVEVLVLHHGRHPEAAVRDQAVDVRQAKALRAGKTK